jgi:hypothetical protein
MNKFEIYMHGENQRDPKLVEVSENASVQEIIKIYRTEFPGSGEETEIELFVEDEQDAKPKHHKGEEHGIKKRHHVHCHRCKKVNVSVSYNSETKSFSVAPSTTVKKIEKEALKEFKINEADAGDFLLKLEDGTVLQPTEHIGSFTSHHHCQVSLFLTATKPIQG